MANRKVIIWKYVKIGKNWRYKPAALGRNGKLKPDGRRLRIWNSRDSAAKTMRHADTFSIYRDVVTDEDDYHKRQSWFLVLERKTECKTRKLLKEWLLR